MTKVVFGYQSRLLASQRHRSSGCGLEIHFTLVLYSKPSVIVSVCVFVYVAFNFARRGLEHFYVRVRLR